jgi:predicted dienelactone hydrolase
VFALSAILLEVRGITYAAADGMQIPAYLTLPRGRADPGRVCIVGASYGGYAALADLKRMLDWVNDKNRSGKNHEQRYRDRFMGVTGPGDRAAPCPKVR